MKKLALLLFALFPAFMAMAQDKVEYCGYSFTDATLPDGFATYDVDGQTLHYTATQMGFDQGDAWKCLMEENVYPYNYFVASHSRHKKVSGQELQAAEDWLVLPNVMVRAGDAVMTWRSNSICENLETTSTYMVKVSTTGNKPADFTEIALVTIDSDPINEWTQHSISLAEYAGKQVWVAFVNCTYNGELLAVDDIAISGGEGNYNFTTNLDAYVYGQTTFTPQLTMNNLSDKDMKGFIVKCRTTDAASSQGQDIVVSSTVRAKESLTVDIWPGAMQVAYGDTLRLLVSVIVDGVESDVQQYQTVFLSFLPKQHIVIEEGTGNWCGWCPKGIYAMEVLKEKYGDLVLPICVHSDDPMEVEGYIGSIGIYFPLGYPSGQINRKYESEPLAEVHEGRKSIFTTLHGGFETYVLKELECKPMAEIGVTAYIVDGKLSISSTALFCKSRQSANLRMAYILTEDTYSDSSLKQKNYLAGNDTYEGVGDFSSMPSAIDNFVYEDVARGAASKAFKGIKSSLPSNIEVDTPYEYSTTMSVPSAVADITNCSVTAMLIDYNTGHIINAARTKVGNNADSIEEMFIQKDLPTQGVYDMQGRRVALPRHGLYIRDGKKIVY